MVRRRHGVVQVLQVDSGPASEQLIPRFGVVVHVYNARRAIGSRVLSRSQRDGCPKHWPLNPARAADARQALN